MNRTRRGHWFSTPREAAELVNCSKGTRKPLLEGFPARILDGNHLGKSHHRLKVLQATAAGALPGHSLVLLDPERMIIEDVVCCEDAHAQERTMLVDVLPSIARGDLLIDDRNFCTLGFLFAVMDRGAYFITRQHGKNALDAGDEAAIRGPNGDRSRVPSRRRAAQS